MSPIISHRSLKLHNRENTLCSQCNQIEDEQHFLIHCTQYVDVRKLVFQQLNIILKGSICVYVNIWKHYEYMSIYQKLYEYQISLFVFNMNICNLTM